MLFTGRVASKTRTSFVRVLSTIVFGTLIVGTSAAAALPAQSWNGYRWARTGPLAIRLGDNVSSAWKPFLTAAGAQWSAVNNIDFVPVAGITAPTTCSGKYGTVQACSGNYGATGWLGYASVWLAGGFITQATIKLNDYYFSQARYNTTAWRAMTTCQELGHTLGLAHTNESRTDLNTGSCMDYTNDPSGSLGMNGTLANMTPNAVDFAALDAIYATLNSTQLTQTRPSSIASHSFAIEGFDDVDSVTSVPEPASWTLMIAGFGLIGSAMRRRSALTA